MTNIKGLFIKVSLVLTILLSLIPTTLSADSITAYRIYGSTRYETSQELACAFGECGEYENVIIATGKNFPDALSASYLSVVRNAPIILINDQEGRFKT